MYRRKCVANYAFGNVNRTFVPISPNTFVGGLLQTLEINHYL